MGNVKDRGGGGDQRLFEKIKVFLKNQKHEPNIVEITHLCIMHGAHTSIYNTKCTLKVNITPTKFFYKLKPPLSKWA